MIFACGLSAYSVAILPFWQITPFSKLLLFLSAGSVIHAMADEQDMRRMGWSCTFAAITYAHDLYWIFGFDGIPFLDRFLFKRRDLGGSLRPLYSSRSLRSLAWKCWQLSLQLSYSIRLLILPFLSMPAGL